MKRFLPLAVLTLLIISYTFYFSAYSIQNHRALLTHASDLGQIDQAIWNTLHGHLLETTRRDGTQLPRFTDHVEPIFMPLSLVFLIYDGVESLLVAQSLAIALGALAVFLIARKKFTSPPAPLLKQREGSSDWLSVGFAALYLLIPALEAANLAEFHAVTLAPAPLLFAYYFGSEKRWGLFALFAFLALMVKEEISSLVFMLSAYFAISDLGFSFSDLIRQPFIVVRNLFTAFRQRQFNRIPFAFALLSLVWFALTVFVIIPHFSPAGKSVYTCRYLVSEDCREVVRGSFWNERLGYLLALFASVGFVAVLDPLALALGSPILLANVLSNYPAQYSGTFHYSAPVAPYLILAAINGTARLQDWLHKKFPFASPRLRASALALVFLVAFGYHRLAGYTPVGGAFVWQALDAHDALLARFVNEIPRDAIVSATPALHPHLSHRQFIYRYSTALDPATYATHGIEYVMLDLNESVTANPIDFRVQYDDLLKQGYGVVDASDGFILLQRGRAGRTLLPPNFYSYFRAQGDPQIRASVDFGDAVRFLGYDVLNDPYGRVTLRLYWQRLRALDKNFYLVPFFVDANDQPRADVELPPMTVLFWYPTSAWQANDVVVAQTLPVEVGDFARIGLGVVSGDDFANVDSRLNVRVNSPASLKTFDSSTWVDIGAVAKKGNAYQVPGAQ